MVISKRMTTLILRRRHLKFSHFIFAPRTSKGNFIIIQIHFWHYKLTKVFLKMLTVKFNQ